MHRRAERRERRRYTFAAEPVERPHVHGVELAALKPLMARGIRVVSLKESWLEAMAQPALRELLVAIFGWVAEQEPARRSTRVKAGQTRAQAQSKHMGRPKGSKDKRPRRNRREADWRRRSGMGQKYQPELPCSSRGTQYPNQRAPKVVNW